MNELEKNCEWHFAIQEGGRDDGPNDAMMQNFRSKPYQSLVREAVQNSLDAVLDFEKPVQVGFSVGELDSVNYRSFFMLREHILGCSEYYNWNTDAVSHYNRMAEMLGGGKNGSYLFVDTLKYIKVSDANTKGMKYEHGSSSSGFYAFARAAGVSSKIGQQSGGSFGFGKSAYFQLSNIGTVFISTCTPEGQRAFEGVSWLCTHLYENKKVASVGYYDNNDGFPVVENESIPEVFQKNVAGTDFYIMGLTYKDRFEFEEIKAEMIKEALRSFWMAIYRGRLVLNVFDEEISKSTLDALMDFYFPEISSSNLKHDLVNPHPYYLAVRDAGKNKNCFRFEKLLPNLGEVTLYFYKDKQAKDRVIYMRKPMMMVFAKKRQTNFGFYGVFICNNTKGDKILRKLENPAHDEWKANNWRNDDLYHVNSMGKIVLVEMQDYITECIDELFSSDVDSALEITGLNEFLYIPEKLIDNDDDTEQALGSPSGKTKDEGVSLTSEINEKNERKEKEEKNDVGYVRIVEYGTKTDEDVDDGVEYDPFTERKGETKKKRHTRVKKDNADVEQGEEKYRTVLSVKFRVIAQKEEGEVVHHIVVYSPRDVIEGDVELVASGEDGEDSLFIASTDNGKIKGNTLRHVVLEEGRNVVKVKFEDNMIHSLKLKAYENQ